MDPRNLFGVPLPQDIGAELGGEGSASPRHGGVAPRPGVDGSGRRQPALRMALPPDYFPPQGSRYFYAYGVTSLGGPSAVTVLGSFQLPAESVGIIRDVEVGIANMTATTAVQWFVRIDGAYVEGWTIDLAPRGAAYVSKSFLPESTRIPVPAGALVEATVQVTDVGPYDVSMSIRGWMYPRSVEEVWYGV